MSTSASEIRFDDDSMWVGLSDGRTIGVPLAWFPRLLNASADDRENYTLSKYGMHWEALDEDISVEGLLSGQGDQSSSKPKAA